VSNYRKLVVAALTAVAIVLEHFGVLPGGETVDSFVSLFAGPIGAFFVWFLPNTPKNGTGRPVAAVGLVALVFLVGCANTSLRTDVARAESAWTATLESYETFLERDDLLVETCYRRTGLTGDAAREACPPLLSNEERAIAQQVYHRALGEFEALDDIDMDNAGAAELVGHALGRIDTYVLRLLLLTSEGSP